MNILSFLLYLGAFLWQAYDTKEYVKHWVNQAEWHELMKKVAGMMSDMAKVHGPVIPAFAKMMGVIITFSKVAVRFGMIAYAFKFDASTMAIYNALLAFFLIGTIILIADIVRGMYILHKKYGV